MDGREGSILEFSLICAWRPTKLTVFVFPCVTIMIYRIVDKAASVATTRLQSLSFFRSFTTMSFPVKEIKTTPYDGQKPGTSGLRKR